MKERDIHIIYFYIMKYFLNEGKISLMKYFNCNVNFPVSPRAFCLHAKKLLVYLISQLPYATISEMFSM